MFLDFAISTLIDQFPDSLQVWLASIGPTIKLAAGGDGMNDGDNAPIGNVWLDEFEHLLGGLVDLEEDTVVDLEETEELHYFPRLGGDLRDTKRDHQVPHYSTL